MTLLSTEKPLCPAFNQLMLDIANEKMPQGWDAIPDAPATLEDLKDYHRETGRVAVNSNNQHGLTVGEPEAYWAFRAWHDLLHCENDEGTRWTMDGERRMADLHHEELRKRLPPRLADFYADLIRVEVDYANDLYVKTGLWPENPREFAIGWLLARGWAPEIAALSQGRELAVNSVGG